MKKILYFVALLLLLCVSCNYEQDEKDVSNIKIDGIGEYGVNNCAYGDSVDYEWLMAHPECFQSYYPNDSIR